MSVQKGKPGYINAQKKKYLLWTILEFAFVIIIFAIGYFQTGSRLNLFTVVAVLGCLPAAKMLVEWIAFFPYKTIEIEKAKEIETKAEYLTTIYDLVVTSEKKAMQVDAIVISNNTIFGYTSHKKTDAEEVTKRLKELMDDTKYTKLTIKVLPDYVAFLSRVEGLNNIMAIEKMDTKRRERAIRKHILSTCM